MEIKNNRIPDLEKVFNQSWNANSYRVNGIKENIKNNQKQFEKMYGIESKEEINKKILESHSVEGQLRRLKESMDAASGAFKNNNNFK